MSELPGPFTILKLDSIPEEERHAHWLELRKQGIGGSDAAAVLGISKWSSPLTVWLEKTGRKEPADLSSNQAVEWGKRLEDPIAEKFADEHPGMLVERPSGMYRSTDHPHMLANVDRALVDIDRRFGILEVKTAGLYSESAWDDGVPVHYLAQVTHYLAVTGYSVAYVAVLIGGQDYRDYRIERDEDDIADLVRLETDFWELVESDTEPEIIGSPDEGETLLGQHPSSDDDMVPLDRDTFALVLDYQNAAERIKEIEMMKTQTANKLKAFIGDAKGAEDECVRVIWSRSTTTTTDKKRLESEHPGLLADYQTTKPRDGGLKITERK
jgi:putative phage-type endonuclease